jgi:Flp pilus assembly protein CpaB
MRRGRTFILLGLVLAVGAVLAAVLLSRGQKPPPPASATPQPVPTTKIVVAIQPIARGGQIITAAVSLFDWPNTQVPTGALTDVRMAIGKFAKIDIPQGLPILPSMIAESTAGTIIGGAASLAIQPGKVGVAFPLRSTYPEKENLPYDRRDKDVLPRLLSVAFAAQPGDRVDVLACFWVYELDKDFQTRQPNKFFYINPEKPESPVQIPAGRPATGATGLGGLEVPSEPQLPRMVCQWTVQNARVLNLGDWIAAPPTPAPQGGGGQQPTPVPPLPQVATLEVDPQDALVLKYARETGAQLDMVLRAAGDKESKFSTEAVTLQYMFERFKVAVPPKLDYGIGGGGGVPVGAKAP